MPIFKGLLMFMADTTQCVNLSSMIGKENSLVSKLFLYHIYVYASIADAMIDNIHLLQI